MLYMTHACTPCVDSKLFLQTDWDIVNHPRHRPTWHVQLCVRIHSRHRPKWHVQVCVCVCAYMSEACIVNKDPSQVARRWAGIQLCAFFRIFQVEMSLMTVFSSVLKSCKDALQSLSQASVHCLASNNFRSAGFIFPRFVSSAWCHICVYVLERPMQFN